MSRKKKNEIKLLSMVLGVYVLSILALLASVVLILF
jgi:hypothetical protein